MNRPADLRRCIASILRQSHQPEEVIVVDDGASDVPTLEAMFEGSRVRFLYVKKDIRGLCRSRNEGILRSTGEILVFLDDDTELDAGYVQGFLDVFTADPDEEIGGVSGAPTRFRNGAPLPADHVLDWEERLRRVFLLSSARGGRVLPSGYRTSVVNPKGVVPVEFLQGGNMAVRRIVFHEFSFDESLDKLAGYAPGEDAWFSHLITRRFRLVSTEHARMNHYHTAGGRPNRYALARARVIHQHRFLHEIMRPTMWNRLAFGWASVGLVVTHAIGVVLMALRGRPVAPTWSALRGVIAGIAHVISHPTPSPQHTDSGVLAHERV